MANMLTGNQAPSVIEAPPDFPVTWEQPTDVQLPWEQEAVHFPDPITPMDRDLSAQQITDGFNKGAAYYRLPIEQQLRSLNTYAYIANVPLPPPPDGVDEAKLGATMGNLGVLWEQQWLPDIKQQLAYWDAFDLRGADMAALRAHLDETVQRLRRLWEIHFQLAFPMLMAVSFFEETYQDLFANVSQLAVYALLDEVDNKTVEGTRALWQLSRQALAVPAVRQILAGTPADAVLAQLSETAAGRAFLTHVHAYLQEYGRRIDKLYVSGASWSEDPTPVIRTLKGYMAQPDRDLLGEMEQVSTRRQQGVAAARQQLTTFPQPIVSQFEAMLTAAQQARFLKEEHTNWIDFQATYHARQVLLEFGRRLQDAGAIESRDDVFYLTLHELKETVAATPFVPRQALIRERRALEAQYAQYTPPPRLGPLPSGPPPDNPVMRAVGKVFGAPPPPPQAPGELLGLAAAPGTVRGPVKILRALAEADKLEPGDILVAATTTPPWTPLFANIAGVITDSGGILSHPAVVAREYGIPAVVGTAQATTMLQDGQVVEMDGSAGVVRVVSGT